MCLTAAWPSSIVLISKGKLMSEITAQQIKPAPLEGSRSIAALRRAAAKFGLCLYLYDK